MTAAAGEAADQFKGAVNAQRSNLGALKKRSDELAGVCSRYSKVIPPKKFRMGLPPELQAKLDAVGISEEQFRGLVLAAFPTEDLFVQYCSQLEASTQDPDLLVNTLREILSK